MPSSIPLDGVASLPFNTQNLAGAAVYRTRLHPNPLLSGNLTGNSAILGLRRLIGARNGCATGFIRPIPYALTGNYFDEQGIFILYQGFIPCKR